MGLFRTVHVDWTADSRAIVCLQKAWNMIRCMSYGTQRIQLFMIERVHPSTDRVVYNGGGCWPHLTFHRFRLPAGRLLLLLKHAVRTYATMMHRFPSAVTSVSVVEDGPARRFATQRCKQWWVGARCDELATVGLISQHQ